MLETFQHTHQAGAVGEVHPLLLAAAIQTGLVIGGDHSGRQTLDQLHIPLLTGDNKNVFQRQTPAKRKKANGLTA